MREPEDKGVQGSPADLRHSHLLESPGGKVKHNFSNDLLLAGRLCASVTRRLEQDRKPTAGEHIKAEHRSHATAAVMLSFAGLEASANELYLEAYDSNKTKLHGLTDSDIALLAEWWGEVERVSPLCKYQTALKLTGNELFDRGAAPYQEVDALRKLRNALVHYKPEWNTEEDEHAHLEKLLRNRFTPNPLVGDASLWIPDKCLGAGCAQWCCRAVKDFLDDFCQRMAIPARYPGQAERSS